MAEGKSRTNEILARADEMLGIVRRGANDAVGNEVDRRVPGVLNVAVFGRAVTNVLQNLRSCEPEFDEWYGEKVEEMSREPLLRYFYELRSDILKTAKESPTAVNAYIRKFSYPADMARFGPPPPGAKGFFIGDRYGGTGWRVALPDGSEVPFYVNLPPDIGTVYLTLPGAPSTFLGKPLPSKSAGTLCGLYLWYLTKLVSDARARFLS